MKNILSMLPVVWLLLPITASCQSAPASVKPGQYRAVLKTRGGDLPFGLDIQPNPGNAKRDAAQTYNVFALNGNERLPMDAATVQGDSLHIPMKLFDSELVAKIEGNTLRGVFRRYRLSQSAQTLPFEAEFGQTYRFTKEEKPTTNVTGKWATDFGSKTGQVDTVNAVGVFDQKGSKLAGTFLTPTGDYRYLEGNVVGDSLFLSCFDGSHIYLFKAKHDPAAKTLTGGLWAGISGYEPWAAHFDPKAELPDPAKLTYLKPGAKTLTFSFPEPNGNKVSLSDPRFNGKVTIVQIMGSWCPNCMDETNFMSPWYKKNKQRGVEIVGLSFERSPDMTVSGPKIERMKQRFKLDYPVVLAGTNDKAQASKALPELNAVVAFPTTIFLDKKGQVRYIHTGFSGPGTGKYYDQYIEEFNRLIDKLIAE